MTAANFNRCLKLVLVSEGGNDDDPDDAGGRPSRGITQREYDAYRKTHSGLPSDVWKAPQSAIESDLRNLLLEAVVSTVSGRRGLCVLRRRGVARSWKGCEVAAASRSDESGRAYRHRHADCPESGRAGQSRVRILGSPSRALQRDRSQQAKSKEISQRLARAGGPRRKGRSQDGALRTTRSGRPSARSRA
jgi:hypothetical protein